MVTTVIYQKANHPFLWTTSAGRQRLPFSDSPFSSLSSPWGCCFIWVCSIFTFASRDSLLTSSSSHPHYHEIVKKTEARRSEEEMRKARLTGTKWMMPFGQQ